MHDVFDNIKNRFRQGRVWDSIGDKYIESHVNKKQQDNFNLRENYSESESNYSIPYDSAVICIYRVINNTMNITTQPKL